MVNDMHDFLFDFQCPTKVKNFQGRKQTTLPIAIDNDIIEGAKCHHQMQIRQFKKQKTSTS